MTESCILFGAGASFGSNDWQPSRPPLGNQVGDTLADTFSDTWEELPPNRRQGLREDFENETAEMIQNGEHAANEVLRLSGLLFARYRPGPDSTYRQLANQLDVTSLTSATLNYDCLWELAVVEETGKAIAYWGDPEDGCTVLKPHGSCNFRNPQMSATPGAVSWTPGGVTFGGGLEAIDPRHVPASIQQDGIPPGMAFYETDKAVPVSPGIIQDIQSRWASAARSAERLSIIGVEPNHHDNHIFDPIVDTDARLQVVSPSASPDPWEELGVDRDRIDAIASGFDDRVEEIQEFLGTNS